MMTRPSANDAAMERLRLGATRAKPSLTSPCAAAFGPVLEPAEIVNALIAHVFENLAAERRATAGAAIDDHILILGKTLVVRGRIRVGVKFQQAARDVHGAS